MYKPFELYYESNIRDFTQFRTIDNRTVAHMAITKKFLPLIDFLK